MNKSTSKENTEFPDIFSLAASMLNARVFLCAAIAGFMFCCFLGKLSAEKNIFGHFVRFQLHMCLQTNFFPTVSELVALAEAKSRPDQILVVVGGSSIMHGVGQSEEVIWTRKLQNLLGDKFCVINFGFKNSGPFEGAYLAAEALSQRRKNVLYIADFIPGQVFDSATGKIYGYMYWDALSRQLLMPFKERADSLKTTIASMSPVERDRINDLSLRATLDSYFHFTDLWNTVAVRYFSTVWYPYASNPFAARKTQTPEAYLLNPSSKRFEKNYQSEVEVNKSLGADLVQKDMQDNWIKVPDRFNLEKEQASTLVPNSLKKRMLLISLPRCPVTLKDFAKDDLAKKASRYEAGRDIWRDANYRAYNVGSNLVPDDYVDFVHLASSGGTKLANEVYPQIIEMCRKENLL